MKEISRMNARTQRRLANGLGWFGIGLGLVEVFAPKSLASALGIRSSGLVRAFGVREIAAGIGILTQQRKGPWVWARIVGDALDGAVLGGALMSSKGRHAALAIAAVSPVIALDVVCGAQLGLW
jgi:hypothetical protein